MVLIVLAWVLRFAAVVAFVFSIAGFRRGPLMGDGAQVRPEEVRPLGTRVFRGTGFLLLAVILWFIAGLLQGDMQVGLAAFLVAAMGAGLGAGALRRDVRRRLPPKPRDHLNAVDTISFLLLMAGGAGGAILTERMADPTVRHLLWAAILFGIFAGGTFIAWAVARLWLRLKGPPEPQVPYGME